MLKRLLVSALLLVSTPAYALLEGGDIICETTTTTGTGTVNLGGALSNYATFVSQITNGATVPYHIKASDGKLETGIGTFTDATPDTLTRTATWSTDGSGAELTLPAGTHNVCLGPITELFSVGGNFNTYADAGADAIWGWDDSAGVYENLTAAEAIDILETADGSGSGLDADTIDGVNSTAFAVTALSNLASVAINTTLVSDTNGIDDLGTSSIGWQWLYLEEDDAGAVGTGITMHHNSASPADGDIAADIQVFAGADDEEVGRIALEVDDGATTTEDTRWRFFTDVAGASVEGVNIVGGTLHVLASGGVLDFNAGDCTLTDGTNMLTQDGCDLTTENIVPDGDNTRDLGSTSATWQDLYTTTIELGADSDTTLTRSAAGTLAVEGVAVAEKPEAFGVINYQVFTSGSGTYTPTTGTIAIEVWASGGGGGGGGSDNGDTTAQAMAGGGEGGGAGFLTYNAAELGANAAYAVGAGGTPGGDTGTNGGDGGDTTFNPAGTGLTLTALGGDGGDGCTTTSFCSGVSGTGESGTTNADLDIPAEDTLSDTDFLQTNTPGFRGGWSFFGNGGEMVMAATGESSPGVNGAGYGGGASGGTTFNFTTGAAGGTGAGGVIIIKEYIQVP